MLAVVSWPATSSSTANATRSSWVSSPRAYCSVTSRLMMSSPGSAFLAFTNRSM
ncbi:hypothetical protein LT493_04120 [Streptomyces tricolor]|nr:hypothetical protein [Streptomyces tricolor]